MTYSDHVTVVDTDGECSRESAESPCQGPTRERTSRSGLTVATICERHERELEERLDAIDRRYPDTPHAPSWFDPTYAGESWDGE